MAKATLIRFTEGNKSALIAVRANAFQLSSTLAYVGAQPFIDAKVEANGTMDIPDGFSLKPMIDKDGEAIVTQNGEQRHTLVWE